LCVSAAIGAGIGAVVGGVGYGIYIAVTGNEFNWGQFALAAGGGLAAGALIGTGVGWAAGVSQATATTAAVTGAGTATTTATTVLKVTGGDPTDEFNTINRVYREQVLLWLEQWERPVKLHQGSSRTPKE